MSLRARLLLAVGAVALIALIGADVAIYSALRSYEYRRMDDSLNSVRGPILRYLSGRIGPGEDFGPRFAPGTYIEFRDPAHRVVRVFEARLRGGETVTPKLPPVLDLEPGPMAQFFTVPSSTRGHAPFRVSVQAMPDGGQIVFAVPLDETIGTLRRLVLIEIAVTAAGLAVALAVGWTLVRVGLRPLAAVEETAGRIHEGKLTERVPGESTKTEVGRLALGFNSMLDRIQDAFAARDETEAQLRKSEERLRRFVADASHELRTPVAAVSAYAELFGRGASERPEDLARVMQGIRGETGRMARLVEDLLLLARLDEGRPLQRTAVDLVDVAREAMDAALAVGPQWPISLHVDEPVDVDGDPARLRQVLDNLLANVRAHTPAGTRTTVRLAAAEAHAMLTVTDDGPGMTPEDVARVFERFYRAEASRSREHGGAGLGLAIVSAIVAAHGGAVSARSFPGEGTTFTVRLPLAA